MNNSINTIDKVINDIIKLTDEIKDKNRARQQLGFLIDGLVSYIDNTIQDHPLTQDSIDKLNALELQYGDKKLESVKESPVINEFIYKQGRLLADTLRLTSRSDEVELISDQIGAYTTTTSIYGDATGQVPESLGVDLNEAAMLKLAELDNDDFNKKSESNFYLEQFTKSLSSMLR
jgi:hypothetical protein